MSDIDLEAIRARAEAATKGPWHVEYFGDAGYPQRVANDAAVIVADLHEGGGYPARNAEFIAHAREDIPALLAEIERVRALPEQPEMVPNAAEEWQNGYRWGWHYAIKAVREAVQ